MNADKVTSHGPTKQTAGLAEDSDYDLLVMMAWRETDEPIAREAFATFYQRHIQWLYAQCRKFALGIGGEEAAEDLAAEAFRKVYRSGAGTFKQGPSDAPDDVRRHVRGWLATIAENIAKDAFATGDTAHRHLEQEHWQDVPEVAAPADSPFNTRLRELMDSELSEREQFVLRAKLQYYEPGQDHQRLPNGVLDGLAAHLDTTPENVRQIASRAFRKIKQAILRGTDGSPFKNKDVV